MSDRHLNLRLTCLYCDCMLQLVI